MSEQKHDDLLGMMNNIRQEYFPDIPEHILSTIISIEIEYQDNRKLALQLVQTAIKKYAKQEEQNNA